ncbi:MAG TPA: hypothetical protein VK809_01670 [Bacteroidia bacterium]|jgi:hypothetical protein|nr:hypothetical protein [Bacteroidia bacterium]
MTTPPENPNTFKIKQIQEEIAVLKEKMKKPHLTKDAEQDYDIKSLIIDKQAEIIELLIGK